MALTTAEKSNIEVISKLANWIKNCGTADEILKVGTRMRQLEGVQR